jgi:predicted AlkP superfamily phosphohydrolase/phosphomutase
MAPRRFATIATTLAILTGIAGCDKEPPRPKVIILGFDGANWETMEPLIAAGKLPFLSKLREESAWGPLKTFKPTKSPVIWTSIATGKTMMKHGILDFVYLEENHLQVPYSNSEKREPSIWQILDAAGRRSVVVNWFVTYPPDEIDGVMVSNRFRKTLLLRGDQRERMRDSIHPEEYFDELKTFVSLDYDDIRAANELPDLAEEYERLRPGADPKDVPVLDDYWIYVLQETMIDRVSRHLYETENFDFFATYFRLPDIVQHFAIELLDPAEVESDLAALRAGSFSEEDLASFRERMAGVLEPFYRYMESIIEYYVTNPRFRDTYVFVLSDHGFALHAGGYDHYHVPEADPAPDGIFLMKGPTTRAGRLASVNVYDVAPTILYLYGLPVGTQMDGTPLRAALTIDREVEYQRYARDLMQTKENRPDEEIDQKTLEELRSLGYIQ